MEQLDKAVVFSQIKEQIGQKIKEIIDMNLKNKNYNPKEAQQWSSSICDELIRNMTEMNKNFKYMVNTFIMQKTDCQFNVSASSYWDQDTDGSCSVPWESEHIICITNLYAVAL